MGNLNGHGLVKTDPMSWEEAQQLFKYLETKITKTIEIEKEK